MAQLFSSPFGQCCTPATPYRNLLPEPACNVIFRLPLCRSLKYSISLIELNQAAQQKEARKIGDSRRLLHVMSYDHHGALIFETEHELFNFRCRDGVQRRTRLIQEKYLRID